MLTTSADDPSITLAGARVIIKVLDHQHQWLAGGYGLEIGLFRAIVVTLWIVASLRSAVIIIESSSLNNLDRNLTSDFSVCS